jgi:hypothetical protein
MTLDDALTLSAFLMGTLLGFALGSFAVATTAMRVLVTGETITRGSGSGSGVAPEPSAAETPSPDAGGSFFKERECE